MRAIALEVVEELQFLPPNTSARLFYYNRVRDCVALFYMASTFSQVSLLYFKRLGFSELKWVLFSGR